MSAATTSKPTSIAASGVAPDAPGTTREPKTKKYAKRTEDRARGAAPAFALMANEGLSLRAACERLKTPSRRTILRWVGEDSEICRQYARAREERAEYHFDEMLRIADTPQEGEIVTEKNSGEHPGTDIRRGDMVEHRRLQVDTRKWILARMDPKRYGDKQTQVYEGGDKPVAVEHKLPTVAEALARIDAALAK
jgi:hypothetical protein